MFVFFLSHNSPQQTHCVSKTASIRAKEGRHADDDDGLLEEHRFNEKPKSEKGIEHDDDDDDHHHRHIVVILNVRIPFNCCHAVVSSGNDSHCRYNTVIQETDQTYTFL